MQAFTKQVVIDNSVRRLCTRPYPNHPRGCPNFGNRRTCPPQCPLLEDVFDMRAGFWIVWVEFDFAKHCDRMRKKHPDWSQRQVECCLYWQGKVNKMLMEEARDVLYYTPDSEPWEVTYCPEGMGVNVTATIRRATLKKNVGVELEWPPKKIVRKVALIGKKKNKRQI